MYTREQVKRMNATARESGAVGASPVVPRYVATLIDEGDYVLDYGAGKTARHAAALADETGARVDAHDIGENFAEGVHVIDIAPGFYDLAYASNVVNVQPDEHGMVHVFRELRDAVHGAGVIVFNYPPSPCHSGVSKARMMALAASTIGREVQEVKPNVFMAF